MNDLHLVRELRPDTPLPSRGDLAPARDRLLAAAMAERAGSSPAAALPARLPDVAGPHRGRGASPVRRRRPVWQWLTAGLATAAVAAAITGFVVLAPDQVGGTVQPASAAEILHNAATAALTAPDVVPRADQFIYRSFLYRSPGEPVRQSESWMSVDGTHDGLEIGKPDGQVEQIPDPGCRNGRKAVVKGPKVVAGVTEPCTPQPGYDAALPTDTASMLAYLNSNRGPNPTGKNYWESSSPRSPIRTCVRRPGPRCGRRWVNWTDSPWSRGSPTAPGGRGSVSDGPRWGRTRSAA
jgi:hypothetical protein